MTAGKGAFGFHVLLTSEVMQIRFFIIELLSAHIDACFMVSHCQGNAKIEI